MSQMCLRKIFIYIINKDFSHHSGIWFSDVCKNVDNLPVDILIEADQLWNFQEQPTIRGGRDEQGWKI